MPWPTPQEYNEAIQHPAFCFEDAELRAGTPELTPLGLPRPITGNFASVYRVRGARDWAVRCFFREFSDIGERYAAISAHLAASQLPHTVGFAYLQRGIRIGPSWFPVLKMEWVEGMLLGDFVAAHRHDGTVLRELAERWLDMLSQLERRSIAHGDLQHGNVLVVGGELRLVDYDGMFVPSLAGRVSHELGHPNYQHPGRTGREYFARLDHFSGWVVYLSLLALQRSPELWDDLRAGDECLLFRRGDFVDPQQSPALSRLRTDAGLRPIAEQVERILALPPSRVPPVEPLGKGDRGRHSGPTRSQLPSWLEGVIQEPPPLRFAWPASLPRAAGLLTACLALAALVLASAPPAEGSAVTLAAETAVLWLTYLSDPSVLQRVRIRTTIVGLRAGRAMLAPRIALHERLIRVEDRHQARAMARLAHRRAAIREQHERFLDLIATAAGPQEELIDLRLSATQEGMRETEARLLHVLQDRFVESRMRRTGLLTARIEGLGIAMRLRLWLGGVRTAAHISADRVKVLHLLTSAQAAALLRWKIQAEKRIRRSEPNTLPPHISRVVHVDYRRALRRLERRQMRAGCRVERFQEGACLVRDVNLASIDRRIIRRARRHDDHLRHRQHAVSILDERSMQFEERAEDLLQQMEPLHELTFRRYLCTVVGLQRLTRS